MRRKSCRAWERLDWSAPILFEKRTMGARAAGVVGISFVIGFGLTAVLSFVDLQEVCGVVVFLCVGEALLVLPGTILPSVCGVWLALFLSAMGEPAIFA
jgi:hypothetical protein